MRSNRLCQLMLITGMMLSAAATAKAQRQQPSQFPGTVPNPTTIQPPEDAALRQAQEKQAAARNDERQKRLMADADKLLRLATELHEEVLKTNKNVLSLEVIKRADEIERLAHAVKEHMKQ